MNPHKFSEYVKSPSLLNEESLNELKELIIEFPFCSTCLILLAKNHQKLNTNEANAFIKNISIFLPDRKKFYRFINDIPEEAIIEHNSPVYSIEMISSENDNINREKKLEDHLIDKFINEKPGIKFQFEETESEEEAYEESEKEFVSEILAELYWKQGNPEKAIRTYEKLSLKFPEKNTYFAIQIEKIKKESLNN